ncbi:hypothetical protein GIB67_028468 [Kingdonia uniflora]|uniref:Uncharacterized protein n=1 Tax=Kingdonia uniflora TaxID=39325 RepID=A0A7J7P1G6_9MAGN|nr:hypothetical protein GIB67_028468 [Kingdonia uniflora]
MVTTQRQAYEVRIQTKMASLQTRYFGTQSLSLPTPIPVPPTFHVMSWEEVEETEDDFHQLWRFHYVVSFAAHRRSCLRMLAEDAVLVEDEMVGKSSDKYCRYPVKDWMRSKSPKPNSKFVVSASSEESSSSDRTMDDSVEISTVAADNPSVSSGRDAGFHAGDETGQFFKTLVRPSGNVEYYQVPFLDRWKRSIDIGNDIDIVYYNGTGSEVIEEGFLYYLNQVAYGLSIPLTIFQKGVMNALKSCPGQLNGSIFEMMRVCDALNQKWRDGGIARQFIADDVLKYYNFKYVKDRKSGYLFSDSARPNFFDFESSERPWCDHLVMVREIPACVAGTSSSLVRRPRMKKTVPSFEQTTPVQLPPGVNLEAVEQEALDLVTRDPIRLDTQIRSCISQLSVAWKSVAKVLKLAAANRAELVRQYETEKAALQE